MRTPPSVPDSTGLGDLVWSKAAVSNPSGECVELAAVDDGAAVAMRNSRDPHGPALVFDRLAFEMFLDEARCGDLGWITDTYDSSVTRLPGGGIIIRGEGSPESGPGYDGGAPCPQAGLDHHV